VPDMRQLRQQHAAEAVGSTWTDKAMPAAPAPAPTISTMLRKKRAASASEKVPLDTMRSNSSPPTHSSITMCTASECWKAGVL